MMQLYYICKKGLSRWIEHVVSNKSGWIGISRLERLVLADWEDQNRQSITEIAERRTVSDTIFRFHKEILLMKAWANRNNRGAGKKLIRRAELRSVNGDAGARSNRNNRWASKSWYAVLNCVVWRGMQEHEVTETTGERVKTDTPCWIAQCEWGCRSKK